MANARQRVDAILFGIFGKGFDDLPPSVRDALLNSSDMNEGLRAAKAEFQRLASQRSIGTNAPGRSPLEADYVNYPRDNPRPAPQVTVNTGRAEQPKLPAATEAAAEHAQPGFWRKLLTPLSMDVPRRSGLPGSARPQDTAGDAVRKILGYGVIPGAAVGMAARQLAGDGGLPVWDSRQQQEPQEDKPPQRMLNDDILRSLRESTMRQQGMAYPRN